jgi:hypothetical protein
VNVKKAIRAPRWKKNGGIVSRHHAYEGVISTEPGKELQGMAERTIRVYGRDGTSGTYQKMSGWDHRTEVAKFLP